MMVDIKVEVGDTVLIETVVLEVDTSDNTVLVANTLEEGDFWFYTSAVKEVIPKPFDWADVRAGMCFKCYEGDVYYTGCDFENDRRVIISRDTECSEFATVLKSDLARHEKGDIK